MRTTILFCMLALVTSCKQNEPKENELYPDAVGEQSEVLSGRELFEQAGNCASCHQPDKKIIGPSIKEIAEIYKKEGGDIVQFLRGKADPIVDPSQYEVMKTNFAITKAMSDAELRALEKYIYEHLDQQ